MAITTANHKTTGRATPAPPVEIKVLALAVWQAITAFGAALVQRWHIPRDLAMRAYLLANVVIYGGHGLARMFAPQQTYTLHLGIGLLASQPSQWLLVCSELIIAACNLGCFLRRSLRLWQFTAVATAMWASGWACLLAILAVWYGGDYGAPFVWVGLTMFHMIMIRNRFVSVEDEEAVLARYDHTLAGLHPYITDDPLARRLDDDRSTGHPSQDPHRPCVADSGGAGRMGSLSPNNGAT